MFEAIAEFILYSTVYTVSSMYKLIKYIFFKKYRAELKNEWSKNYLNKMSLTFAFIILSAVTSFTLLFWGNVVYDKYFREKTKHDHTVSIKFKEMLEHNKVHELIDLMKHKKAD